MNTPHPNILPQPQSSLRDSRRGFLKTLSVLPVALSAARLASRATAASAAADTLPRIRFGPHSMSRLVCGANPFNGGSHLSVFVNKEMKQYYTPEQVLKTLRRCQEVGINFWQSGGKNHELYQQLVAEGGRMRYISLGTNPQEIAPLAKAGCIAIAHHGEVTDRLFKQGQLDDIHDFLKRLRDAGLMVGVSTHMPAVVDAIESKGWDVDFYMCCVYERHRSAEELQKLLGAVPIPVGEVYLQSDPPRMFKAMRQTKRPCLAFKILAAGRLSERREWVENAFKQTFAGIKPTDGVIVGIYDKFTDQPAEDAGFTKRFGLAAG
ncbi:MAG: hypothetical protein WCV00_01650 [Verrucomicrobiia bacterium]